MERLDPTPRRDPVAERLDTIRMSDNDRERAKDMMRRAERFADVVAGLSDAGRGFAQHARRALRRLGAHYQGAR